MVGHGALSSVAQRPTRIKLNCTAFCNLLAWALANPICVQLERVCPKLDALNLPNILGPTADFSAFAISSIASMILTAGMTIMAAVLACIRAPCLRKWVDWPLKDSHGLHPSRSPRRRELCSAHGACSCLAPCFGRQGCCGDDGQCSRCAGTCTFQILSIYVRYIALAFLLVIAGSLFLIRWLEDQSGTVSKNFGIEMLNFVTAYIQSLTLNWFATSFLLFSLPWLCAKHYGAHFGWGDFPLPFRAVVASNHTPFPEEAVADIVVRAPQQRRRVPIGPAKRVVHDVYPEFLSSDVKEAVDAAVARFDAEVASRDNFGRALAASRACSGAAAGASCQTSLCACMNGPRRTESEQAGDDLGTPLMSSAHLQSLEVEQESRPAGMQQPED